MQTYLHNFSGELKKSFQESVLNFRPRVLNIQALDIEKQAKGLTTQAVLYILKHIWGPAKRVAKEIKKLKNGGS